ncbi:HAMP domain-containing sensor histidine kinase [Deinococcus cellulosilyticus]|uniref:histidine kinase n=1 Tax=Deinococcus cellulosilyticus (strain DSM 18568 / NBRC 106333 / KACC 11606 / 5516J-15) TaxID=1223518 RepID=A0A511N4G7_DEIC1|nr:HAMP domain-containing sensor histidine kinase [Deinococcus cellulosilyticus]GEM47759.1 hypothetical protein DC3_33940 [Deinococcus cellulosilyticus NBRC 106333 = KACC 11606]
MLSIRARNILLVSALTLLVILVGTSAAYIAMFYGLKTQEATQLQQDAELISQVYQSGLSGRQTGGLLVDVYDPESGDRIYQSDIPALTLSDLQQKNEPVLQRSYAGRNYLIALQPTEFAGADFTLAVRKDITYLQTVARDALTVLAGVVLGMLIISIAAVYVVTRTALAPLVDVSRQTRAINENNLKPIEYQGADDELGLLVGTLNRTLNRLGEAIHQQKVLLAEASHELRTPLTAISGYLRRAEREVPEEQKQYIRDAARVSESMTRLVNDLLQLSRGEIQQSYTPHFIELDEQLQDLSRDFPGLEVETSGILELIGDPERLMQVWRNLVSNAVRASGDIQKVHIAATRIKDTLRVEVIDHGPGITDEEKEKIFQKFYRGKHSGSSGLGLTIVAQIIRMHQGNIQVLDTPGGGATFRVELPALEEE